MVKLTCGRLLMLENQTESFVKGSITNPWAHSQESTTNQPIWEGSVVTLGSNAGVLSIICGYVHVLTPHLLVDSWPDLLDSNKSDYCLQRYTVSRGINWTFHYSIPEWKLCIHLNMASSVWLFSSVAGCLQQSILSFAWYTIKFMNHRNRFFLQMN